MEVLYIGIIVIANCACGAKERGRQKWEFFSGHKNDDETNALKMLHSNGCIHPNDNVAVNSIITHVFGETQLLLFTAQTHWTTKHTGLLLHCSRRIIRTRHTQNRKAHQKTRLASTDADRLEQTCVFVSEFECEFASLCVEKII